MDAPEAPTSEEALKATQEGLTEIRAAALSRVDQVLAIIEQRIAEVTDPSEKRRLQSRLAEARALKSQIGGAEGSVELSFALLHQPSAKQLTLPGRPGVLLSRATRRIEKSGLALTDLRTVLGSVAVLVDEADAVEISHRLMHYIVHGSITTYGLAMSRSFRRIVAAARLAMRDPGELPEEGQQLVLETKAALLGFLKAARGS